MRRFFETLYSCLTRGARAVLQIYPENADQAQNLTAAAMKAGFSGGLVVDFPNSTRAKKYFLVLSVGGSAALPAAKGLHGEASDEDGEGSIAVAGRRQSRKKRRVGSLGAGVCVFSWSGFAAIALAGLLLRGITAFVLLRCRS